MKTVCVDTHTLVWYLMRPAKLGRLAARVLRDADAGRATVLIPTIVAVELSILRDRGKRVPGVPELEALLAIQPAFEILSLDLQQARELSLLAVLADPFDRLIVAAARSAEVPLLTADGDIRDSSLVDVIWD